MLNWRIQFFNAYFSVTVILFLLIIQCPDQLLWLLQVGRPAGGLTTPFPNGVVKHESRVMNLGVEPKTMVLTAQGTLSLSHAVSRNRYYTQINAMINKFIMTVNLSTGRQLSVTQLEIVVLKCNASALSLVRDNNVLFPSKNHESVFKNFAGWGKKAGVSIVHCESYVNWTEAGSLLNVACLTPVK